VKERKDRVDDAMRATGAAGSTQGVRMMSPFEPPLQLAGTPIVFIRSLDDAAGFLRGYIGRWPVTRDLILRRLNAASTEQETGEAAKTFRWWAQLEGLLLQPE
jgi:hypothetical protein